MVKFIGEIGINHNGKLENALELTRKFSFLDTIKIQKMHPKTNLSKAKYESVYKSSNAFGKTYGEHKEFLELSVKDYDKVEKLCRKLEIGFAASVWDIQAAKDIFEIYPDYIKIPSGRCNDFKLIDYVSKNYATNLHISTGMTRREERNKLINRSANNSKNYVIYSCTSNYNNEGNVYIEKTKGFSCHRPNILFAQAAIFQGASFIEYHITTDRKLRGSDHGISLLPQEYKKLIKWYTDNRASIEKIRYIKGKDVDKNELAPRKKLWKTS